jgi:hypothetical protein
MKGSSADWADSTCIRSMKLDQHCGKHMDLCTDQFDQRSIGSWLEWVPGEAT